MNHIDVSDNAVTVNGHHLEFPLSYDEIKAVLGEARLEEDNTHGIHITYIYDDLGLEFEGSPAYLSNLKKKKAYKDKEHIIISMTLYVTGNKIFSFKDRKPAKNYVGNLTVLGQKIDQGKTYRSPGGYSYSPLIKDEGKEKVWLHVKTSIYTDDEKPLYDGDRFSKDVCLTYYPERPKSNENYNIVVPDEDCLVFDTFNFKLAVVNELMYNREVLKPYFDIYDYMAFKKANWNLETDKNVRAAVNFFKELPVPARLADLVTEIKMDGSDDIYMQIAPEWDGRDSRFDFYKLTESEIKQFKNLKKMQIFGNSNDVAKLKKMCGPLGIEIEPLAELL